MIAITHVIAAAAFRAVTGHSFAARSARRPMTGTARSPS